MNIIQALYVREIPLLSFNFFLIQSADEMNTEKHVLHTYFFSDAVFA